MKKVPRVILSVISILLFFTFIYWLVLNSSRGNQVTTNGTVSLSTQESGGKTYTLKANAIDVVVTGKGLSSNYKEYIFTSAVWENGDKFSSPIGCMTSDKAPRTACIAVGGQTYWVQVHLAQGWNKNLGSSDDTTSL